MTAPQITLPPTPAPNKFGGDPVAFDTAMQARIDWHTTVTPEHNAMATWMNELGNELASSYQSAANITIAANTATSQAAAAVVAKDAAVAAWAASTSPAETLASISKSLHYGAVVKAIIYDTSKDSDGGAWRKRCADKSWYTEALGFTGTWGGQAASNAAGWAACGSVVGGAYQSTADGKFYTPTSSTTQTEIFRGNVREFPEAVAIVAESTRVVIYDLTQVGTPMWMVLKAGASTVLYTGSSLSSVAAKDSIVVVGDTVVGLITLDFVRDKSFGRRTSTLAYNLGNVANRNTTNGGGHTAGYFSAGLVNGAVNDVALTVLDNAPIDAATGLPTPTIAVATAGGISVIKDDGTVVNSSQTDATGTVAFSGSMLYISNRSGVAAHARFTSVIGLGASWTPTTLYNYLASGTTYDEAKVVSYGKGVSTGGNSMLALYKHNPASSNSSLRAQITIAYNSGWLPGDIRGAYLADTVAETITASGELVLTPDFAADTNWTKGTGWSIGSGVATKSAGSAGNLSQVITTVVGRTYTFTFDATRSAGTLTVQAVGATVATITSSATTSVNFTATSTSTTISFNGDSSFAGAVDNASVKLADPDRSVKNMGLTLVGSLTKAAVASGAALVAYSGFSASNYLEQPYNSDLDFGTGDFSVMGWIKEAPNSAVEMVFSRGYYSGSWSGNGQFNISVLADGTLRSQISDDSYASADSITSTAAIDDSTWKFATLVRRSSYFELWINGVKAASDVAVSAAASSLSNTSAVTYLGRDVHTGSPLPLTNGSLALWRISATAPSADQIAHIYRTELPLFQAGAQCTIAGGYAAVTALAYDEVTDILHTGSTYGRSGFRDLLRIDSEATTNGAITALSANQGAVLTGGATAGSYYQPAMLLRDELRRKDEARKALGKVPVFFDFDAVTSQVAFVLPKGYATKAVYSAGTLKRLGAAKDYTTNTDGFQETVTFAVAPGNTVWVSVMAVRS